MEPAGHERGTQPRERIIETATRLYAALGYDATSIAAIADASGFDVPTITALVGDNQTLYRAVINQLQVRHRAMFDTAITEVTHDRAGIHQVADNVLDHFAAHPELAALWIHRWQSDAADIPELESVYLLPVLERLRALIHEVTLLTEADVDLCLWTIGWTIRGFCVGGVINSQGEREGPENFKSLERFRQHLHRLTDLLFGLDR